MYHNNDIEITLDYLPKNNIRDLVNICNQLIATQCAEYIILYGSYARGTFRLRDGKDRGRKSDYDILVITENGKKRRELMDKLIGKFQDFQTLVNVEVHTSTFVNSEVEEAHYYFMDIKHEGKILYDKGTFKFAEPVEISPQHRRVMAEDDFHVWYTQANGFFSGVSFYEKQNNYRLAAFQLQQACEMSYNCVEMVFRHYRTKEHKLKVLRERVTKLDRRIDKPFPIRTPREKALFEHLDFAYIGGRYLSEQKFSVTLDEILYWKKEAKLLLELTKEVSIDYIEKLRSVEKDQIPIK